MGQRRSRRAVVLAVTMGLLAASCDNGGESTTTTAAPTPIGGDGIAKAEGSAPRVFGLQLSEGQALLAPAAPDRRVEGDELDASRVEEITARLPEWSDLGSQHQSFRWPVQSPAPPRAGETIDEPFPPSSTTPPPVVDNGPLKVLRYQPEGDVSLAPYVAITFNQPMVPVGTVGQVNASDVPVTITPALEGRWQWIGTRTLRFDYEGGLIDRLPMATDYTVTVPAGTKSAAGGELSDEVTWQFTTPPPVVQSFSPEGDQLSLEQLFTVTFDQRIDPADVLATIRLRAAGADVDVRLATAAEIETDDQARMMSEGATDGRWLVFRAVEPLPTDTALRIEVGPETPSAEGPLTTADTAGYSGRTYAPLEIVRATCGYSSECVPGSELTIEFNNQLDGLLSDTSKVAVSPALVGANATVQYNAVSIRGATLANTEYRITVPGSFTDVHGQTLGKDETVTVKIGNARPSLLPADLITTLDPFATTQRLSVYTVNHDELRVRVFAADPAQFAAYLDYTYQRDGSSTMPAWEVLSDAIIAVEGDADTMVDTPIDLGGWLSAGGQVIVLVEPVPAVSPSSSDYYESRPILTWVQRTNLGIDVLADARNAQVWATDLRSGAPLVGVDVRFLGGAQGSTDADGLATLALPPSSTNFGGIVVATSGGDTAILLSQAYRQELSDESRWFVFDDRQVYRPGETMRVKGWVRKYTLSGAAEVESLPAGTTVGYTVTDSYGNQLLDGVTTLTSLGGFDLDLAIPDTANLGPASLNLQLESAGLLGGGYYHQFQIEQYRRPEFEVTTRPESEGPYVSTEPVTVAATGAYYAGGPLPNAPVDWVVSTTPTTYSPPGWDGFTFGVWIPWWYENTRGGYGGYSFEGDYGGPCCGPAGETDVQTYSGTTDADGTHYLQIDFEDTDGVLPDLPVAVSAQATVTDVNRQAWASNTDLLVHAANRYVGLRSSRTFVRQGDPLSIDAVVTGIDGEVVAGVEFEVIAGRVESQYVDGEWAEVVLDPQTCTVTSAGDAVSCEFDTTVGGQYKVTAVVAGTAGGRNRSELTTWVSGAESQPTRGVDQQTLTVVPDKAEYAPGDIAELLVQAPFATGEGLVTISRNGIRRTLRFQVENGSAVVSVPIVETDIAQLGLSIEVVGATQRANDDGTVATDAPLRPAYAVGSLNLSVPPVSRTLDVVATPRDTELAPGESTSIDVTVKDANGAPVAGAEFAVVVVDEAVLALSGYTLADPLSIFYATGYEWTSAAYSRQQIRLVDPARLSGDGGDKGSVNTEAAADTTAVPNASVPDGAPSDRDESFGGDSGSGAPVTVRSNFDALALFQPSVTTAADGTASIELTLPDNLTRYRVMVVAANGVDQFGSAENNITARLPLAVRPSAPRFANYGDSFQLPVVVQNQSNAPMDVDLVLETSNLANGEGTAAGALGRRVTVPANDRVEVLFPVATIDAGTAGFRVTAVSGDLADSATVQLPVYTPATVEAFATYGVIDDGATAQPVLAPTGVIPQFGGLDITTSSTNLQALTDAVLYIVDYPYESADGHAARIMSIAALRDVLAAFEVEGLPTRAEIDAAVTADIAALTALQNDDGGFSYWRRFERSEPFITVQVAHALLLARNAGYTVSGDTLDRTLAYVADIEAHFPNEWSQQERNSVSAYALWVRSLAGQRDTAKAEALYSRAGDDLTVDAIAWLWSSIVDEGMRADIEREIGNRSVDTAGAVTFTTDYADGAWVIMQSDRRTDGIVLDALIANSPESDLIPKVVTGLLGNQVKGRWQNVQENAFILLALTSYFDTFEAVTPDFVAKVWLGERFAGEHTFEGRTTDRSNITIPTSELITAGDSELVLAKDGSGRLYYRIGMRYAPADLSLAALDRGFVVDRVYEAVDDPSDVTRDADGTWRVKAGARVRVTLTMVAESQRTFVALVDPLPAGMESLNPSLAITQTVPSEMGEGDGAYPADAYRGLWWGTWYQYEQLRDDRTEAFTTLLAAGTYTYSYVARATTPGTFVVPPTRAEEMYAPETFGRTASDLMVIE